MDPTHGQLKDQVAIATQRNNEKTAGDVKDRLRVMKPALAAALDAGDVVALSTMLGEIVAMPLTWEAANETAVGKEVGKCAKHEDQSVAEPAKAIIASLHKLAKQQRPMWVR